MKKNNILTYSIIITLILTIVLGNSVTFDFGKGMYKGIPLKATEILMGINLLFLIAVQGRRIKSISSLNVLIVWLVYGIIAIFINVGYFEYTKKEIAYGLFYALRVGFYIVYSYCMVSYLRNIDFKFKALTDIYIFCYAFVAVIGYIQLIVFPEAPDFYDFLGKFKVYLLNPDPHSGRLISLYLDPNFLGTIMVMGIMLCTANIMRIDFKSSKNEAIKYVILLVTQVIALSFTVSRSGIGTLVAALMAFGALCITYENKKLRFRKFPKLVAVSVSIILISLVGSYFDNMRVVDRIVNMSEDPSAQARVENFVQATEVVQKSNPIFGVGYNMSGFVRGTTDQITSFGVDSSLMFILLTTGVVGIIIYGVYVLWTLVDVIRLRNEENFYMANVIIAVFIASIAGSFFNNLLFYPLWFFPFLVLSNYFILQYRKNK